MPPAPTHCPSLQHITELRLTEPNGRKASANAHSPPP
jgi:hypothetical protein